MSGGEHHEMACRCEDCRVRKGETLGDPPPVPDPQPHMRARILELEAENDAYEDAFESIYRTVTALRASQASSALPPIEQVLAEMIDEYIAAAKAEDIEYRPAQPEDWSTAAMRSLYLNEVPEPPTADDLVRAARVAGQKEGVEAGLEIAAGFIDRLEREPCTDETLDAIHKLADDIRGLMLHPSVEDALRAGLVGTAYGAPREPVHEAKVIIDPSVHHDMATWSAFIPGIGMCPRCGGSMETENIEGCSARVCLVHPT